MQFFFFFWKPRLRGARHWFKVTQQVSAWGYLPYNDVMSRASNVTATISVLCVKTAHCGPPG